MSDVPVVARTVTEGVGAVDDEIVEVELPNGATALVTARQLDGGGATKTGVGRLDLDSVSKTLEGVAEAVKAGLTKAAPIEGQRRAGDGVRGQVGDVDGVDRRRGVEGLVDGDPGVGARGPTAIGARAEPVVTGLDPLLELLATCVVAVERDGRFEGTGFWVAPGELLTCAHVVHGGKPITVTVGSVQLPAEPVSPLLAPDDPAARFYPQPDVALLRVPDAPAGHPCVRLDAAAPAVGSDVLQLTAFTVGENAPGRVVRSGASLHLESLFAQDGVTLFKLREGQVIGGFSGGPLLNRRTGRVCALVDSSRNVKADLGGFGVPAALFEQVAPGLLDRNAEVHSADRRWVEAVEAQRVAEADRAGRRVGLPLLPPVVELDWTDDESPSELLQARYAVVPFVPRGDLLEQVMRWRESDTGLSLLVLTGAGGFGKTRTAVEVCRAAQEAGWTAGHLVADSGTDGSAGIDGLDDLLVWPGRLLVAVDYAETRPVQVTRLLTRLRRARISDAGGAGGAPGRRPGRAGPVVRHRRRRRRPGPAAAPRRAGRARARGAGAGPPRAVRGGGRAGSPRCSARDPAAAAGPVRRALRPAAVRRRRRAAGGGQPGAGRRRTVGGAAAHRGPRPARVRVLATHRHAPRARPRRRGPPGRGRAGRTVRAARRPRRQRAHRSGARRRRRHPLPDPGGAVAA